MTKAKREPKRDERIAMEVTADAYGPEEQAIGWYTYLEDKLRFPFDAKCIAERGISPLSIGDKVHIVGMASVEECQHEMFVEMPWKQRRLAIPLSQIKPVTATDAESKEAVADWHYWVGQGYEL